MGPEHTLVVPRCSLAVILATALAATSARAQPLADGPPSASLERALRLFEDERYAEARPLFERAAYGGEEIASQRERARFFLGKTLFRLGRFADALVPFDAIAQRGPAHPYFEQGFSWLLELHPRVPATSEARLLAAIGRYEDRHADRFDLPESRETFATACYLLGRARFAAGRYGEARRLFQRVPEGTRASAAAHEWTQRTLATVGPQ